MRHLAIIALIIIGGLALFIYLKNSMSKNTQNNQASVQKEFSLISSAFEDRGLIPKKYTCDAENINPPLEIRAVPAGAKSLVLIMDDPDVPKNLRPDGMWVHWVRFNIPVSIVQILEGKEPEGVAGSGTGGNSIYTGPCPPDREHRYFFKLYALDINLPLQAGADKTNIEKAMERHILDKVELIGRYNRSR